MPHAALHGVAATEEEAIGTAPLHCAGAGRRHTSQEGGGALHHSSLLGGAPPPTAHCLAEVLRMAGKPRIQVHSALLGTSPSSLYRGIWNLSNPWSSSLAFGTYAFAAVTCISWVKGCLWCITDSYYTWNKYAYLTPNQPCLW